MSFRFDAGLHEYTDLETGDVLPHITGMLEATGWVDDLWFTEESCVRGQAVHTLTANYDLGGIDVASCHSAYRGYLLGHVKAMSIVAPAWRSVEEPHVHPRFRFGGRPDRVGRIYGGAGVLEVKSGLAAPGHEIQTALQAILVADDLHLQPQALFRFALYLKKNGKFKLEEHRNRRDFDEARRIIKVCCQEVAA